MSSNRDATPAQMRRRLQAGLLPVRRMLSRAVLVYEERHFRDIAVGAVYAALASEARKIRDEMIDLEERVVLRVDILMEELWRRTEGVGARQATEVQRLAARLSELATRTEVAVPELHRLAVQMAEAHRLAGEAAGLACGEASPGPGPVSDLDQLEDPTAHLAGLPEGSLGAARSLAGAAALAPEDQGALVTALARALRPGGAALFGRAGPDGPLAGLAREAGLQVEESHTPEAGLVNAELADPALRLIAETINALADQLNQARRAQGALLVVRKPSR